MKPVLVGASLFLVLSAGFCGFENGVVPQDGDPSDGLMTATVDGVPLRFQSNVDAKYELGALVITGGDPFARHIRITLYEVGDSSLKNLPRFFRLAAFSADSVGFGQYAAPIGVSFASYTTTAPGSVGGITIKYIDDEHLEAEFSFNVGSAGGSGPGHVTITDGTVYAKWAK